MVMQEILFDAALLMTATAAERKVIIARMLRKLIMLLDEVPASMAYVLSATPPRSTGLHHSWTAHNRTGKCRICNCKYNARDGVSCQAPNHTPSTTQPPSNTGTATMLDLE